MAMRSRPGSAARRPPLLRGSAPAIGALLLQFSVALADPALVRRGEEIAAARCATCHAIGPTGTSPQPIVPPLRTLHEDFPIEMLANALGTGVLSGHDEMPMFDLGLDDTRALLAYIDSLKPDGPQYLVPPSPGR